MLQATVKCPVDACLHYSLTVAALSMHMKQTHAFDALWISDTFDNMDSFEVIDIPYSFHIPMADCRYGICITPLRRTSHLCSTATIKLVTFDCIATGLENDELR